MERILRDPRAWGVMLAAMLTIMSNATITPALIGLQQVFADNPHAHRLIPLLVTAPSLIVALVAPFAGVIIDRIGRRPPLLAGLVVYALAGTAGLYLHSLEAILASRLALGLGVAAIMTAQATLLGDYFAGPARGRLMGYQVAATNIGGMAFVTLAGVLAAQNARLPFAIYGLAILLLPILSRLLPEPPRAVKGSDPVQVAAPGEPGWPGTVTIMAAAAGLTFVIFYMVPTLLPYLLAEIGAGAPQQTGRALSVMMLASSVLAVTSGWVRPILGRIGTPLAGYALLAVGFWLVSGAQGMKQVLAGAALIGAGLGLCMPTFLTTALNAAPARHRGLVSGLMTAAVFLGQFLSPLVLQPMVEKWGLPAVFALGARGCIALGLILGLTLSRRPQPVDKARSAH
ncbi:MFS transporter [Paracoccus sp. S1E-3]|uniref:MFS transporter n=1 Tax=Paracoccus sp. S1E-3 TaxID=2756130 RepID=UPI0015EE8DA3|nr:MFS transporter [Paracoccus sp. S1E-3]MBA4490950.1 MFS transporter [Paracoccus sp. S1E-3]